MTATRFALPAALVLILSAFACNAQRAPPGSFFGMVNLHYKTTEYGDAECFLKGPLSQDLVEQLGNGQLRCFFQPELPERLDCEISGNTCQDVKSVCENLDGQIKNVDDNCKEIEAP